ncbi:nuclear transport factor 2 family protein [Hymenobacter sp. 102]|uniref:nuclear transport factor 2 family protein n=1 Tax=Hymenobacter sp. 102 TaxID=3403152 RepID=UPI003CE6A6E1
MEASRAKKLVTDYVEAYNAFDVAGMLRHLHAEVVFRNISGGQVNLTTTGKESFRQQAERAKSYFSQREQRIIDWQFADNRAEVRIDYSAVAAVDFPNGLKAGDALQLQGRSVFQFAEDRIVSIDDIC